MESHRAESPAAHVTTLVRLAGIALGGALLLALILLIRTATDTDRAALLSEEAERWSLPIVVAVVVVWASCAVVLASGRRRLDGAMLMGLRSVAMVAAAWLLGAVVSALGAGPVAIVAAVAIGYLIIGAVDGDDWVFLTAPLTTSGLAIVTLVWGLLAVDPRIYVGVERELWGMGVVISFILASLLPPLGAAVLVFIGRWLGVVVRDRLT